MTRNVASFALVVGVGLVFSLINTVLVSGAVYVNKPDARLRDALGSISDYSPEAATIGLGIGRVARPLLLLLLIMGITLAMHRLILLRQLREKASTDSETGLLNADAWNRAARSQLFRAVRVIVDISLLMLDLDISKPSTTTMATWSATRSCASWLTL